MSHYSLSYVYISLLIVALFGLTLLDLPIIQRISRLRQSRSTAEEPVARSGGSTRGVTRRSVLTWAFVALFIVVSQLWYIYSAGGSVFYNAVSALNFIVGGLHTDFLAANTTGAGAVTSATTSPLYSRRQGPVSYRRSPYRSGHHCAFGKKNTNAVR